MTDQKNELEHLEMIDLRIYTADLTHARFERPLEPLARDIAGVRARSEAIQPLENGRHTYPNEVRCITPTGNGHAVRGAAREPPADCSLTL